LCYIFSSACLIFVSMDWAEEIKEIIVNTKFVVVLIVLIVLMNEYKRQQRSGQQGQLAHFKQDGQLVLLLTDTPQTQFLTHPRFLLRYILILPLQ
jgi:hypothetical protein